MRRKVKLSNGTSDWSLFHAARKWVTLVAAFVMGGAGFSENRRVALASDGEVVSGVVTLDGPRPQRKRVVLRGKNGEPSDCHQLHAQGLLDENLLVGENNELANVFVYVKKGYEKKKYPPPPTPAILNQVGCMFRPRVQGVMVGQDFVMKNGDPVLHNVRALSFRNRPFNVAQPAQSADRTKVFTRKEKAVTIQCDLHPWMKAYCFVMDHPWFAVTDKNGRFRIEGLPAGEYTLAAWHEELDGSDIEVKITPNGEAKIDFSLKPIKSNVIIAKVNHGRPSTSTSPFQTTPIRTFVRKWAVEDLTDDKIELTPKSIERGQLVFDAAGCRQCHVMAGKGEKFGPDLTDVVKRFQGEKLIQQILKPSSEIHKEFQTQLFLTQGGRVVSGLVVKDELKSIHVLPNPLRPENIEVVEKADIAERRMSDVSTMPEGLLDTFKRREILDLLAFLQQGGQKPE